MAYQCVPEVERRQILVENRCGCKSSPMAPASIGRATYG